MSEPLPPPDAVVRAGASVELRNGPLMHGLMWFGAAVPFAMAVAMAILVPQDEPDAPIVPIVAITLLVAALPLALWWFLVRGVQYVVDGTGLTKTRWRRASVRWEAISDVQTSLRQIIVRAPSGVQFGGQSKPASELRITAGYLEHGSELPQFLYQCWLSARRG